MLPDTFEHELVTVLVGERELVVLTGCAHNGVLNMIEAAGDTLPDKPIRAVVGRLSPERGAPADCLRGGEDLAGDG